MRNINKITWTVILAAMSSVLGYLIISDNLTYFLAPRIIPMVYFGFCVFVILFIYSVINLFKKESGDKKAEFKMKNLLFIIPVLLIAFTTPDKDTVAALPDQDMNFSMSSAKLTTTDTDEISDDDDSASVTEEITEEDYAEAEEEPEEETSDIDAYTLVDSSTLTACVFNEEDITSLQNDRFEDYLLEGLDALKGREITLYGFVYKDDYFPESSIAVSRLLISCCVADATTVGFYVKVEDVDAFESDEWICVTGTVYSTPVVYYGDEYEFPLIVDGEVTRCETPEANEAYVYP